MKICNKCGVQKSFAEYGKRSSSKDGLFATCKACRAIYNKQWHKDHQESRRKSSSEYRRRSPDKGKHRAQYKRYGLFPGEKERLLELQGGVCKMCSTDFPGKGGWHTDHCHSSGKVRGILCHNCNRGIGYLKDDPKLVAKAVEYLETSLAATSSVLSFLRSTTPHLSP